MLARAETKIAVLDVSSKATRALNSLKMASALAEGNEAKKVAAYEITKLIHGEEEAKKAEESSEALFGNGGNIDNMPTTKIEDVNISILEALVLTGVAPSKGQAKTLIAQGGISLNDNKIEDISYKLTEEDFKEGYAILRKGKKVYHKLEK